MKILFLIFHGLSEHNGISKKIRYQVEALRRNGAEVELCCLRQNADGSHTRMIGRREVATYPNSIAGKIRKRICYGEVVHYVETERTDLVYIRGANNCNPFVVGMIRRMRRAGARVVWEIPTYPYDGEFRGAPLQNRLRLAVDRMFRRSMGKRVDYIVTYADTPEIFGAPTVRISNGIDFDRIPLRAARPEHPGELHLIGVAELHFWHGFDRLIRGLADYYAAQPALRVVFHVVGYSPGDTLRELRQLTEALHLEQAVVFHGPQYGQALDALFACADLGIASLGRHRSGITRIKTLKNREYAARGIPFVYSESDADFDERPYVLRIPADESPVRIEDLIAFHDRMTLPPAAIRRSVTDLAWDRQMKKVTDRVFSVKA